MSRKVIIILVSILIAIAIGVGVVLYILSFRTVTFDIVPENMSITISRQGSDEDIATLNQDGLLQLQNGTYIITPMHEDYSSSPIPFTVAGEDMTISIDPDYSSSRLATLLETEQKATDQLLRQTYPDVIKDFTIQPGTLYQKGQWYATTLQQNPLPGGQQGDTYRVVLQKVDDQWQIAAGPEIVLSAQEFPDIPQFILSNVNSR